VKLKLVAKLKHHYRPACASRDETVSVNHASRVLAMGAERLSIHHRSTTAKHDCRWHLLWQTFPLRLRR